MTPALIPMFCEMLMKSDRIPDDYDMSHLRSIGTGAEPMNERKSREVEEFFHRHNCMATLSAGYGQSEGCSNFTLPNPMFPLKDGCVGMPMPATILAVFDPETLEEKNYGEIGEVCMNGPAKMLYYGGLSAGKLTERTLVPHPDGDGKSIDEVKDNILATLEPYEYPVEIRAIKERPYFHFKTNRKELTEAILKERNKEA